MQGESNKDEQAEFRSRLVYLAWRWYQIPEEAAEELVQAAHLTWLEVRDRYAEPEHPGLLVGIFRNKCREHIDTRVRAARRRRALLAAAEANEPDSPQTDTTQGEGILSELIQREDGARILWALSQLRPEAREMFRLIVEEGLTRKDLRRRYQLNKNTLDSRLHTYRRELKDLLARAESRRAQNA